MGDDILTAELEKKRSGWFKNALSNQPERKADDGSDENYVDDSETTQEDVILDMAADQIIFSREAQDKTALDVITSLENLLKERQLIALKNQALNEQINTSNETIQRIKRESIKKDQQLQEKVKEIRELESNLTSSQMGYDQLLEDYKEYQLNSNLDFDKISNQLETEKTKYEMLYEEASRTKKQLLSSITELEDRIRNLEIENQKFAEQYDKISGEKADLLKSINDFTEKMSFSFIQKNKDHDA